MTVNRLNEERGRLSQNSLDFIERKYKENQKILTLQSTPAPAAQNLILPSPIKRDNDRDSIYKNEKKIP
jgi:hypothetical protein